jgi:ankyrin repeat protein
MEQGYLAQVQALIDQKWKENPEEMKRVMSEIKAKEKQKAKTKTPKGVSFDPQLTQELIKELNKKDWDYVDASKIKDLIERGADVGAKTDDGWTPLHLASSMKELEIAKLLLERGADVEAKNNDGWTPLHLASEYNRIETAKLLLDAGADLEAEDDTGWTPLHWASEYNRIEIAKLLIELGADVGAKDVYGNTPLDLAQSDEMQDLLE